MMTSCNSNYNFIDFIQRPYGMGVELIKAAKKFIKAAKKGGNPDAADGRLTLCARTKFNEAVRDFKKTHRVKLKDLFAENDPQRRGVLRKKFWSNPIISSYFSRDVGDVAFTQYHPEFHVERQGKTLNDYYEWRIYDLAGKNEQAFLPYRKRSLRDTFYTDGTMTKTNPIESLIPFERENKEMCIMPGMDTCKIRKELTKLQFNPSNTVRFVLSPVYQDTHALALLSILERGSDRILASIMINSLNEGKHFERIRSIYFLEGKNCTLIFNSLWKESGINCSYSEEMYNRIKKDHSSEDIYVDQETSTGYIFNHSLLDFFPNPAVKKLLDDFNNEKLIIIHSLESESDQDKRLSHHRVKDRRSVVFLDASHILQTAEDDENCALYTVNILHATSKLIEDPAAADRIYNLALQANDGTEVEKVEAQEALVRAFREEIKTHLPFYYHEDGSSKSKDSLREFHLQQRWEMGRLAAKNPDYLRKIGFLPSEESEQN